MSEKIKCNNYPSNSSETLSSKDNNEKTFSVNSLNSPKTNSNIEIIIAIVIFATFSIIGLGYLTWKKME